MVSGDSAAQQIAGGYGAQVVEDDERGSQPPRPRRDRMRHSRTEIERVLLVPGDCPLLDPLQIDALLHPPAGAAARR